MALFFVAPLKAQTPIDETAKRALLVGRSLPQERVFVQFDNSAYFLGETIWFKAYATCGNNDRPSNMSKVLYAELLSPEGYIVESKRYKLDDNGCCNGEFELKPSLLSGYYEVRAYTRYMLNSSDDAIFSRVFPVFDKVNGNNWDFKSMLDRKRIASDKKRTKEGTNLSFYPEGGHLINGIENRVAYELFTADGTFGSDSIIIYENNVPIASTAPVHYGKGAFAITPKSQSKYHATVIVKDTDGKQKMENFEFPKIEKEGVSLFVTQNPDSIFIYVRNNFTQPQELGFSILHRGAMGYYKKIPSGSGEMLFTLNKKSLPEGVCRAVVFTNETPLAERQFFIQHKDLQKGDRETARLTVKANNYQPYNLQPQAHEKIVVSVARDDGKPLDKTAELCISVADASGFVPTTWDYNMYTYLLLGSEIKGYIPNASYYFDAGNTKREEHLDLLMLIHGWTSYDWSMLTQTSFSDLQPIEKNITLKGAFYRLKRKGNTDGFERFNEAYNPIRFDISSDNDSILTSVFRTDSLGRFIVEIDDFYGNRIASLSPNTPIKTNENIRYAFALDRYFSPQAKPLHYWESTIGRPASGFTTPETATMSKTNPLEYLIDEVEIVQKKKKSYYGRPPLSELRFDYLDEWEYAKDVTYLPGNGDKNLEMDSTERAIWEEMLLDSIAQKEMLLRDKDEMLYLNDMLSQMDKISMAERQPEYRDVITANNVLRSIFTRYKLPWCYWIHSIVTDNEYHPDSIVREDKNYLHGKDAEKMTNFKEIVIRSDKATCQQFDCSGENFWISKDNALKNKYPDSDFYKGFLSMTTIYPRYDEIQGEILYTSYEKARFLQTASQLGKIHSHIRYPNHVACFIPHKQAAGQNNIVPEYTNYYSTRRYTSIKGYSESKKFYSPDYSRMKPDEKAKDYRRTLLWIPDVKTDNGELKIEFYNSTHCNGIEVKVSGRQGNIFLSNDNATVTRTSNIAKQDNSNPSQTNGKITIKKDSVALAQYAEDYAIGTAYYKMKKYQNAIKIFAELQQYDYAPAVRSIGICYMNGHGVKKNMNLAAEFLLRATELGDAQSMYDIAIMYKEGAGIEQNSEKSLQWLQNAAKNNEPRAQALLGAYYLNGNILEKNPEKASVLLRASALQNEAAGLYLYGIYLQNRTEPKNDDKLGSGTDCIEKAAQMQYTDAMLHMMQHHDSEKNYKEAYSWANKLHQAGNKKGTEYMAYCYMNGLGVKRDKQLAEDLYREAGK